jgi:hypothetical protein
MRRLSPYAARARMIKMRGPDSGLEEEPLAGGGQRDFHGPFAREPVEHDAAAGDEARPEAAQRRQP